MPLVSVQVARGGEIISLLDLVEFSSDITLLTFMNYCERSTLIPESTHEYKDCTVRVSIGES